MNKPALLGIGLLVALLSAACAHAGEAKVSSAPYDQAFGQLAKVGVLVDGDDIQFEVRAHPGGPLLDGARMFVGDQEIHGEHGRFAVPYSRALLARNPVVRVVPPRHYEGRMHFEFGVHVTLTSGDAPVERRERADLSSWATLDVGPDRIYLEPPHTVADAASAQRLLSEVRALLERITGVSPPPIAIAIAADAAPDRYTVPDREGRNVWLAAEARTREDAFIGLIAHEWTHALLRTVGFPNDAQLRYVEDGLAELLGVLAERRLLGRELTPILEGRRAELAHVNGDAEVDLYELAAEHSYRGGSLDEFLESQVRPEVSQGYAFGLAYWLHRTGARADTIRAQFDAWRRTMPKDASAIEAQLRATGPSPRSLTLTQARAWLSGS